MPVTSTRCAVLSVPPNSVATTPALSFTTWRGKLPSSRSPGSDPGAFGRSNRRRPRFAGETFRSPFGSRSHVGESNYELLAPLESADMGGPRRVLLLRHPRNRITDRAALRHRATAAREDNRLNHLENTHRMRSGVIREGIQSNCRYAASAARTCASCSAGLTLRKTWVILPSASITKVVRSLPM